MIESDPDTHDLLWSPTEAECQSSNIGLAMSELGFATFAQLYDWSISQRESFWRFAMERLTLRFAVPPTRILETSPGLEAPDWLVGAQLNIAECCFQHRGDAVAVRERSPKQGDRQVTYAELRLLSGRVAHGLKQLDIKPGTAIAVFLPMTIESVAIYLGILLAGCTVVSIADSFSAEQVATRLRIGEAQLVFTVESMQRGAKQIQLYDRIVQASGPLAIVIEESDTQLKRRDGDLSWRDFLPAEEVDNAFDVVYSSANTPINILFSSGTTGEPKAIVWDPTTAIKAAVDGHFHQDIQPGNIVCWPTSLGWMMGPWLIFATLANRGTIALFADSPTEPTFAKFVEDVRVDVLGVVPSLVHGWRVSNALDHCDWTSIRRFSSTGESSNPDDMRWLSLAAGGKPIIEYCGGTEVGGGYITGITVVDNRASMFSSPTLGTELLILGPDHQPADEGEIFLVPPTMGFSRRLVNRDHHEVYFRGTPHVPGKVLRRHGDEMRRLPNGYFQAVGRVDDTMNLGGIKVGTAEIEQTIAGAGGVRELAAIAVAPPGGGPSNLVIYAAGESGIDLDPDRLQQQMQQLIREHLNPLFKIHSVKIIEQLPRTASNKIMRRKLRDLWQRTQNQE
jgi:acetyl-CoA synthetase